MIGSRIRERLEELGLTQADLSRKTGLSTGHISDLVNNKRSRQVTAETLATLVVALNVDPSYFLSVYSEARVKERKGAPGASV